MAADDINCLAMIVSHLGLVWMHLREDETAVFVRSHEDEVPTHVASTLSYARKFGTEDDVRLVLDTSVGLRSIARLTMLVGILISVLQVVTQVQEMSLTFVPKLFTAGAVMILAGPWMLRKLTQFTVQLWSGIPSMF